MPSAYIRYAIEFGIAMTTHVITGFVSIFLLDLSLPSLVRIPIALMPMIPACFIPIIFVRLLRRIDELQRKMHLEALGFAFAGTALLTLAYGNLQLIGFPEVKWYFVWQLMSSMWGIGLLWAGLRRYR